MEITLDFPLIRKITSKEHELARVDIAALGPVAAFQKSLERHDTGLASAADAATLACKPGCAWCCHFSIDVRPVEVLNILDFVEQEFSETEKQQVLRELQANSAELRALDEIERIGRNIKCPFLRDQRCTVYAARPQTCRNYHATDAAGCKRSFEEPGNLDIDPEYAPLFYQTGNAHVDAFSKALHGAGYDIDAYEMNTALASAMAQPEKIRARFLAGHKGFDFEGLDVPLEFMELEE